MVENCRIICDLKQNNLRFSGEDISKRKCYGWIGRVKTALKSITGSVANVDDGDLMNIYPLPVAFLEILFIKSCKNLDPSILHSKDF